MLNVDMPFPLWIKIALYGAVYWPATLLFLIAVLIGLARSRGWVMTPLVIVALFLALDCVLAAIMIYAGQL